MTKNEKLKIMIETHSNLDPKRNLGIMFDNYGKCPKCGSMRSGLKSTLEEQAVSGILEYECLICGTQWQEFSIDHETEESENNE